jgi:hypothetical protein
MKIFKLIFSKTFTQKIYKRNECSTTKNLNFIIRNLNTSTRHFSNFNNKKIDKKILIGISPNSKLFKEYKKSLKELSKEQWDIAIGLMLGDVSLQTQNKGKTYRMKFEWSDNNKAYLDHVYNIFEEWVISKPHKKSRINSNGKLVITWGFQTISHEAFNPLADLFISNNKKSISNNLIKNHLTNKGLAFWWMDDGGKLDYNKNSKNKSIVLNTQSFTQLEVDTMTNELSVKFNLSCEVRSNKGKWIIVIKDESFVIFKNIINLYIIPQMIYKLPKI